MRRDREFEEFVGARSDALRRTAFLMCGDWHLAEDALQDALVKLYVAWPRVRREGTENSYVRQIVARTIIDQRRRPWRRERVMHTPPDLVASEYHHHDREPLAAALAEVPLKQRTVLVLRFWEDMSVQEVADELNISEGTVKSQTSRGLERIRQVLAQHEQLEGIGNE